MEATVIEEPVIPPADSCGIAKERVEHKNGMRCHDWFFCTKEMDKEAILAELQVE